MAEVASILEREAPGAEVRVAALAVRTAQPPMPELPPAGPRMAPRALTPAVQDVIVRGIEMGMPYVWAARLAGVGDSSLRLWRSKGEADEQAGVDTAYARLVAAVKVAEATAITRSLAGLAEGGRDWTRHAWLLERRWPEEYGRRDAVAVGVQGEVRVVVEYTDGWAARDVIEVQPAAVTAGA